MIQDSVIDKIDTYHEQRWFQIEIDGVHDDENLLVFVGESGGLLERCLAVVLDPAVLTQKR